MPHLAAVVRQGVIKPMRSIQPTVSCVAWATYMTGKQPGKHGIYGFIDRKAGSYDLTFPNAAMLQGKNIWEILNDHNKRVFGMNVCTTYPPRAVNGILIGCFLAPSLERATYPASAADYLKSIDYRIDSDAALARRDKAAMLDDLDKTLDARAEAMFHYLEQEPWDFFHTHIMETDRINHFLWGKMEDNDPFFAPAFFKFYQRIDAVIGRLLEVIGPDTPLLIFSDHGFCRIQYEVQLSRYLVEKGWTTPAAQVTHPLAITPEKSKAYCLIPGRIYVNLQGREPGGIVPLKDYQATRLRLKEDLLALRDPQSGAAVLREVKLREELYWPDNCRAVPTALTPEQVAAAPGTFGQAPDLIAIPHDGYDLKLGLAGSEVFMQTQLEGMHTFPDATMIARGFDIPDNLSIMNVAPLILKKLNCPVPADMDG